MLLDLLKIPFSLRHSKHVKVLVEYVNISGHCPSYITSGDKAQVTVLGCASGYAIPPFVVFDRMTLNPKMHEGEVPGALYGLCHSGWMNKEFFNYWFLHHFLEYSPIRPLILLLDGHSSHYCPETIKLAAEKRIILFALPPHTTHITQPLDRGCFAPLKVAWMCVMSSV